MTLLAVRDLNAGYGRVRVLHGIHLHVDEGEAVAILGPNGAGKTTTLRALCGMVRTEGEIELDGQRIERHATESVVRLGVAHVREGRGTFTGLTVEENLRVGAYSRSDREETDADIERCYEYFPRLRERRDQPAGNLSGGEQQMLAIGRGLMLRPRLMLLDEPSLGMAPKIVRTVFDALAAIRAQQGTSMLIVEQNARLALKLADRAHVLETGRIVLSGPSHELANNPEVGRAYLGT